MTWDEMKNRISMALKDPILQQGFEIICKELDQERKLNAEIKARFVKCNTCTFETKIIKAIFLNQEIVVFPSKEIVPNNITEVVKFLFGEGAVATQDCINNCSCIRITGATYVLDNAKTLNADWEYKEVEDDRW